MRPRPFGPTLLEKWKEAVMSEKMMSFEEFRVAAAADEGIRQQVEHFRDPAAAEELLRAEALREMGGWLPWPPDARLVDA